jgi:hypothetical protein
MMIQWTHWEKNHDPVLDDSRDEQTLDRVEWFNDSFLKTSFLDPMTLGGAAGAGLAVTFRISMFFEQRMFSLW